MRPDDLARKPRCVRPPTPRPAPAAIGIALSIAITMPLLLPSPASAAIDPLSGIDFVRIGAVGNAPWPGDGTPGDRAIGRGSVGYEYSIGRFEVNTVQWVEFFNAAFDRPTSEQPLPWLVPPQAPFWGASTAMPNNPGAPRWRVNTGQDMHAVGQISWRTAAMYANWLHNGKSADREAFLNGAYDVSTFADTDNGFTDQVTHHPDARYWIPTFDEQLKAFHFDPNMNGGQGGYWRYSITRDTAPLPGPPPSLGGTGDANFGFTIGPVSPFSILLGAYTGNTSPWGLYDTAGATSEWSEEVRFTFGVAVGRYREGSWWAASPGNVAGDLIHFVGDDFPSLSTLDLGFRIASSVPSPGLCTLGVGVFCTLVAQQRKR